MAAFPSFDIKDLSDFSGRGQSEYMNPAFVPTAIAQATLLFKLGTCLGDNKWPEDPTLAELAKSAVLAMADAIYLVQPFQATLSNPFQSEAIGSYSYSKLSGAVMSGIPSGIAWFDMAVSKLGVCDLESGVPTGGGIEIFEGDGFFTQGRHPNNLRVLSPQDIGLFHKWTAAPDEGYRYASEL